MITYHISRQRWDSIKSQGYPLGTVSLTPAQWSAVKLVPHDAEYHFLEGERGLCEQCNVEFDSVVANTPAELDEAKEAQKRKSA